MQECSGEEITREWLYHLGVPLDEIDELAATGAKTVPVMMPYVTAFFMPRQAVRRVEAARLHLHHRVFGAHADGSGVHPVGYRARRAGGVQFHL
ncbi:hypothetical protein G6F31_019897 [Rhizopus arrhizus]|nr:hypothetical protein G6F24_018205 [Rhizopus arrhizus]KAG0922481.1 hypothetical protein G6F31_019897 [Rhizopus arrhizus]